MFFVLCPYCKRPVSCSASQDGKRVTCDKGGCPGATYPFEASVKSTNSTSNNSETPLIPWTPALDAVHDTHLTHPHLCVHCQQPMPLDCRSGRRRGTQLHRRCSGTKGEPANRKSDTFAVIYHCENVGCSAILETPTSALQREGSHYVRCPQCNQQTLAPIPGLLQERSGDQEGETFDFRCPACPDGTTLRVNRFFKGKSSTGQAVACFRCLTVVRVPPIADNYSARRGFISSQVQAEIDEPHLVCTNHQCRQRIPKAARRTICPECRYLLAEPDATMVQSQRV